MLQAHDLLWLRPGAELLTLAPLPDWAAAALALRHPVVVRRGARSATCVPVGLRGATRGQRFAAQVKAASVTMVSTPESLARRALSHPSARSELPALAWLRQLLQRLPPDLAWGPTGSVGFELATGLEVVRPDSDLDIVIRADTPISRDAAKTLLALFANELCRCDVQLATPNGGVALVEWARGERTVLLKTDQGPRLVGDPWDPLEGVWP